MSAAAAVVFDRQLYHRVLNLRALRVASKECHSLTVKLGKELRVYSASELACIGAKKGTH